MFEPVLDGIFGGFASTDSRSNLDQSKMDVTGRSCKLARVNFVTKFCVALLCGCVLIAKPVEAARILCVPAQVDSHTKEVTGATEKLQDYGHELYLLVSNLYPNPERYEKQGFKILRYQMPEDLVITASEWFEDLVGDTVMSADYSFEYIAQTTGDLTYRDCGYMMADKAMLQTIRDLHIDLVVVDGFVVCLCNVILPEYLGLPYVTVSSIIHPLHAGVFAMPNFVTTFLDEFPDKMSLPQKLLNTVSTYMLMNLPFKPAHDVSLLREYNITGTWMDIFRKSALFIFTRDHVMEWPMPATPNFVPVPGLTAHTSSVLPDQFTSLMTSNDNGVIVMTFGSMFSKLPKHIVLKFTTAFARLDQTVIWRLNLPADEKIDVPANVHVFPWLPQASLLAHPNTRLFITHCGNGGQHEATYHGVPMLGIPLFAEQPHNAFRMEHHGIGRRLDLLTLTSDDIYENVMTLLTEPRYKASVMKMSGILKDRRTTGQEEAAYWINHVVQFGGDHLRPATMDMPAWEFWMLDMIMAVLVIIVIINVLLVLLIKGVIRATKWAITTATKEKRM